MKKLNGNMDGRHFLGRKPPDDSNLFFCVDVIVNASQSDGRELDPQVAGLQPRQLVAWVAQQQEEELNNRFDMLENLPAFGHRQFLPVPPVKDIL